MFRYSAISGEDDLMQQALSLSLGQDNKSSMVRDISSMTEEEQLHYALQMSMSQATSDTVSASTTEKQTTPVDAEMKDVRLIWCYFKGSGMFNKAYFL